jgi:hypothetical protein
MRASATRAAAIAGALCLALALPAAAEGAWRYEHDFRGHPELKLVENVKEEFYLGCGRAVGLWVAYRGSEKIGANATLTLSNGKATLSYQGEVAEGTPFKTDAPYFLVWNLGAPQGDPALNALLDTLLDAISAGAPITVSTGDASHELPAPQIANLKEQFRKGCPGF